jgi:uncharacterized protein
MNIRMRRRGRPARSWQFLGVVPLAAAVSVVSAALPTAAAPGAAPAPGHAHATGPTPAKAAGVNRTGYITLPDGVKLAYDLTLPTATGRFPVALEYDYYSAGADNSAENPQSDAGRLLAAGFAVLGVNQPGSGCSGGVNDPQDVDDWGKAGAQVVEWAAARPWSTGHVGMFGSSETGITALGVASFHPRGLDAIAPFHVTTDFYRDFAYPGGVYNSRFIDTYAADLVQDDATAAQGGVSRGDRQCITDFDSHVQANRQYSIAANMLAHPFDDAYWQDSLTASVSRVNVPVLGCQSWQDGVVSSRATEIYYDTLNQKTSWFIGMNGAHNQCEFTLPLTMMINFMRHYVAGVNNGWQDTPHITVLHDVSANPHGGSVPAWVSTYDTWPSVMKPVTLYFRGNGSLATATTGGRAAGQSSFSGPAPSQSGAWAAVPAKGTSVSWTSPPLAHDADFFGPASVNLWLSSTAADTDVEVILSEVRPDGKEQYVQASWLDVAQRKLAPPGNGPEQSSVLRPYQVDTQASYQPLTPGRPVYARVELLPFEHVFRAGSSIRITIDSAMGTVQPNGSAWGLNGLPGPFTDTIYASPSRQSELVLGLIPGATAKEPLPACGAVIGEPCRPNTVPVPSGGLT